MYGKMQSSLDEDNRYTIRSSSIKQKHQKTQSKTTQGKPFKSTTRTGKTTQTQNNVQDAAQLNGRE